MADNFGLKSTFTGGCFWNSQVFLDRQFVFSQSDGSFQMLIGDLFRTRINSEEQSPFFCSLFNTVVQLRKIIQPSRVASDRESPLLYSTVDTLFGFDCT